MKRLFLLLTLFGSSLLWAGSSHHRSATADRDLDGVPDRYDRCPNTPFFALVNKNGCMIKKLKLTEKQEKEVTRILSSGH